MVKDNLTYGYESFEKINLHHLAAMTMIQFDSSDSNLLQDSKEALPKKAVASPETPTPAKIISITSRVAPWFSTIAYPLGRNVVLPFYFGHIEVIGREHLPTEGAVILAPTHRSRWDAFMVPYAAGRDITGSDLRFMVSADEMKGLQGWIIRRFGGFPVDPQHPGIGTLRHSVELLRQHQTLVIFPEGNIYRDSKIQPLKPGLARMALQAESSQGGLNTKIVPISIKYSQSIPQWGCNVQIRIGVPLEVAAYTGVSSKQSAKKLTADLEAALQQLHDTEIPESKLTPIEIERSESLEPNHQILSPSKNEVGQC